MRNCLFVITVTLAAAGAGSIACSDDNDASSPLQPSPLATATAGAGPRGLAGAGPSASPVSLTAGAGDVPGLSRVAPLPEGFNAYDARIEYRDGEVTITFVPVDMPGMPDAAREYRNRTVTVWQCPVEPHHVGQTCGEPVFQDSFAFEGSPARTFPLPDCAGWLVIEAAELSDDFYDGWRNAPLACRQDEEGRTVTDVDTGGGAGWEDSRFDPPVRRPSAQSVIDAAIAAAGGLKPNLVDPVSVAVRHLFSDTEDTTGDEYMATSSDETVVTVEVTGNPQVVITPVAPGTATITIDFLRTGARVQFDVTVTEPSQWPVSHTIRHAGGSSRLVIERPGADDWARGSCTFGGSIFAYHKPANDWRGLRCNVVVHDFPASSPDISREYRFEYTDSQTRTDGIPNQPVCHGLNSNNFDGNGHVAFTPALTTASPPAAYNADRWICQMRDFNPGTGTYAPNKIRNVSFDTSARRLSFEIDLGGELIGRELFIGLWLWNHPGTGYLSAESPGEGPHHYENFPN